MIPQAVPTFPSVSLLSTSSYHSPNANPLSRRLSYRHSRPPHPEPPTSLTPPPRRNTRKRIIPRRRCPRPPRRHRPQPRQRTLQLSQLPPLAGRGLIISACSTEPLTLSPDLEGPASPTAGRCGAGGESVVVVASLSRSACTLGNCASRASLLWSSASACAAFSAFFRRSILRTSLVVLRVGGEPSGPPAEVYFSWLRTFSLKTSE